MKLSRKIVFHSVVLNCW